MNNKLHGLLKEEQARPAEVKFVFNLGGEPATVIEHDDD